MSSRMSKPISWPSRKTWDAVSSHATEFPRDATAVTLIAPRLSSRLLRIKLDRRFPCISHILPRVKTPVPSDIGAWACTSCGHTYELPLSPEGKHSCGTPLAGNSSCAEKYEVALAAVKILPPVASVQSLELAVGGSLVVNPGAVRVLKEVSAVVSFCVVVLFANGEPEISRITVGS